MISLYEDETIEDLQLDGLRMIQQRDGFRFGEDSVLLAHFVLDALKRTPKAKRFIVDLGCNCGSIDLILSAKLPGCRITGIEIAPKAAGIFKRNIKLNRLEDRMGCICKDWKHIKEDFRQGEADCIISNPPYAVFNDKSDKEVTDLRIAREEIYSSLDQLLQISSYLLKPCGRAFYIYRANRLADVLEGMRMYSIEPRTIRFVQPFLHRAPTAFLVMGQKDGKAGGLKVEAPLVLFDSPSKYTEEVLIMYGKYPPLSQEELFRGIEMITGESAE